MRYALVVSDPGSLGNDAAIQTYIEDAGHTCVVVDVDDPAVDTIVEDPVDGFHALIVGSNVTFTTLYATYEDWPGGVWYAQGGVNVGLRLASAATTELTETDADVLFGEHEATGRVGNGALTMTTSVTFGTVVPANFAAGVVSLAEIVAGGESCWAVCEVGAALTTGTAAGRRCFMGCLNGNPGNWTAEGQARFLDAIEWAGTVPALIDGAVWTEYSVGATARDFAAMHAGADSAISRIVAANPDLVAQNITLYLTPYADADFDEEWLLQSSSGWITDATRRIVIEPVGSNRYRGTPGEGVQIRRTAALSPGDDFVRCDVPYTRFGYIEIDGSQSAFGDDAGNNSSSACKWNADGVEVHNLYIHDVFVSNRNRLLSTLLGTDKSFWNIEVSGVRRGANSGNDCSGIRLEVPIDGTAWLHDFVVRDSEDMGLEVTLLSGATATIRNGTVVECAGDCYTISGAGAGGVDIDYCSSEDGTMPGANSDTGVDPGTEFVGQTPNSTAYFTLAATAVGRASGEDLGAVEAATDITGTARPDGGWDRAARQGEAIPVPAPARRFVGFLDDDYDAISIVYPSA